MRIRLSQLRKLIREAVHAPETYMKKEKVREKIQAMVSQAVDDGNVGDQDDLDEYFKTLDMAINALRMVPYEAWQVQGGSWKPGKVVKGSKR